MKLAKVAKLAKFDLGKNTESFQTESREGSRTLGKSQMIFNAESRGDLDFGEIAELLQD